MYSWDAATRIWIMYSSEPCVRQKHVCIQGYRVHNHKTGLHMNKYRILFFAPHIQHVAARIWITRCRFTDCSRPERWRRRSAGDREKMFSLWVCQPQPLWSRKAWKLQWRVLLWFFMGLAPELVSIFHQKSGCYVSASRLFCIRHTISYISAYLWRISPKQQCAINIERVSWSWYRIVVTLYYIARMRISYFES